MKTINKTIHLKAFGTSGRMLFTIDFEPYFPESKYYSTILSLYDNKELAAIFDEEVGSICVEEQVPVKTERGFYEGMTVEIYPEKSPEKLVEVPRNEVFESADIGASSGNRSYSMKKAVPFQRAMSA